MMDVRNIKPGQLCRLLTGAVFFYAASIEDTKGLDLTEIKENQLCTYVCTKDTIVQNTWFKRSFFMYGERLVFYRHPAIFHMNSRQQVPMQFSDSSSTIPFMKPVDN